MRRPLFLILAILIALAGLAAWEFPNYLRKPSLRTFPYPAKGCTIELFSDGARVRDTAVFYRVNGMEILLDVLGNDGISLSGDPFGSLRWTRDGSLLVSTVLEGGEIETDKPMWAFDTGKLAPVEAWALEITVRERGGLGDRVFSWFDVGKEGRYLFSWDAKSRRQDLEKRMRAVEEG